MSTSIRSYINQINLTENFTSKKNVKHHIINAIKMANDRYHDVNAHLLNKVIIRGSDIFSDYPQIVKVLDKISVISKTAMENRNLILLCLGMVSSLISLAGSPNAAIEAASQLDNMIQGTDLDSIELLNKSPKAKFSFKNIPNNIRKDAEDIGAALKSISAFFHSTDNKKLQFEIKGAVDKKDEHILAVIRIYSLHHAIAVCDLHCRIHLDNGHYSGVDKKTGVKFLAYTVFSNLDLEQKKQIRKYFVDTLNHPMTLEEGSAFAPQSVIINKKEEFAKFVVNLLKQKPEGKYRIHVSPKHKKVTNL